MVANFEIIPVFLAENDRVVYNVTFKGFQEDFDWITRVLFTAFIIPSEMLGAKHGNERDKLRSSSQ